MGYPREEPGAGKPHARICEGEAEWPSYSTGTQEFIRFLSTIEAEVPAAKQVHVVLDNYAAHKHPKVVEWLGRHFRFTFHFTPTSA